MSAVHSVSTSGVLVIGRPRAFAAGMSMWSVPTEQVAAIFTWAGMRSMTSLGNFRCEVSISASAL